MLTVVLALFPVVVSVFLIVLCARTDDRKKERRERNERSRDSTSSDRGVFDDRLEEISENMTFHVIAKSNKEQRKQKAVKSIANNNSKDTKSSETKARLGKHDNNESESV